MDTWDGFRLTLLQVSMTHGPAQELLLSPLLFQPVKSNSVIQLAKGMAPAAVLQNLQEPMTIWRSSWSPAGNLQWLHSHHNQPSPAPANQQTQILAEKSDADTAVLAPGGGLGWVQLYKHQYFNSRVYIWAVSVSTLSLPSHISSHFVTHRRTTPNTPSFFKR